MTRLVLYAAVAGLAGVSCDLLDARVCTASVEPGIVVTIVDSVSGAPRAADAMAEARAPSFADTLGPAVFHGNVMISRRGAHERPGIYEVIVQAPGYDEWRKSGVLVRSGECHVQTVALEARLKGP